MTQGWCLQIGELRLKGCCSPAVICCSAEQSQVFRLLEAAAYSQVVEGDTTEVCYNTLLVPSRVSVCHSHCLHCLSHGLSHPSSSTTGSSQHWFTAGSRSVLSHRCAENVSAAAEVLHVDAHLRLMHVDGHLRFYRCSSVHMLVTSGGLCIMVVRHRAHRITLSNSHMIVYPSPLSSESVRSACPEVHSVGLVVPTLPERRADISPCV